MAKNIVAGVDIINTLHQKNDANFYIAYGTDIYYDSTNTDNKTKYKDSNLTTIIDDLLQADKDYSTNLITVTIPSSSWNTTNIYTIDLSDYVVSSSEESIIMVTPYDTNSEDISNAKFDICSGSVDTTKFTANDVILICNGDHPSADIKVNITILTPYTTSTI